MKPKLQTKQTVIINDTFKNVWEYNQDLSKIAEYHPRVRKVDLISNKQFREAGVSYQCHLLDGKNTRIERDIEIVPMEKIVTEFPFDTMGLTKLLPHYIAETTFQKIGDNKTKMTISHFYSSPKLMVRLLHFFIKRKIARDTVATLNAIKKHIENGY